MTEHVWSELREHAVTKFGGQTPGAQLEQRVIEAFVREPARVAEAVDRIGAKFQAGLVRSPWPVLALDVEEAPAGDVRVSDTAERDRRVLRAEQWMRAAGREFPSWPEVRDELFGDRGALRAFRADEALAARLETLWRSLQAEGVAA